METSPAMIKAARSLLGWNAEDLADAAGLGVATVRRYEIGGTARQSSVDAMVKALEAAGLEFIAAGGKSLQGGAGVRASSELPRKQRPD